MPAATAIQFFMAHRLSKKSADLQSGAKEPARPPDCDNRVAGSPDD
jgi:hypothetical protein